MCGHSVKGSVMFSHFCGETRR